MSQTRILITGGTGWVGSNALRALQQQGHDIVAVTRSATDLHGVRTERICADDADGKWPDALRNRQLVLHLAARVHVMKETTAHPLQAFREVNTHATLNLAKQAAAAGVRRFVFVSSVKVNGEATEEGAPFTASDVPAPQDPYGISKMEAEQGLREIAEHTGMEVVIVRPPLVYGPGVKANFASLMRAVQRGIPLPLASVTGNRRSLVALDNLVDLLITCIDHPAAANQTFLVSDGEDLSTADLLRRLGQAMHQPARLFPVPPSLLQLGARLLGKGAVAQRLLGNLQVDISHTRNTLNWSPPISVDEGLRRAAAGLKS
ncbi:MAG: SDR family oxidoreductase [Hydrogenophaga sp.]|uniref:UDP-glucose 4-epimerase family protein n=1 Tax=Hydrogenophaga sp. TaxID=1904254 RepID=UPI002638232B|nr:SDR family oxidoreductase [Hydrogenophaga sp.]MDM7943748.1 SDR family oxidoreductase [Hydrogenophaga sp.]